MTAAEGEGEKPGDQRPGESLDEWAARARNEGMALLAEERRPEIERADRKAEKGAAFLDASRTARKHDEEIAKLAKLHPVEYDRQRKEAAKALACRADTLDRLVRKVRGEHAESATQGEVIAFDEPEPWPDSVDGSALLNDVVALIHRHVVLSRQAADTIALWTVHSYLHEWARISPILAITSPERRCGKTTLLTLLAGLVHRALPASNVTPSALFRTVARHVPTLLIDEADSFVKENEELRGILNSGHTRGAAFTLRNVGDDHEPRKFSTWSAKVLCLIGTLHPTLEDRSITVNLRRKLPGETVTRLRHYEGSVALRSQLVRLASDLETGFTLSSPEAPAELHDRAADNWEGLIAIAELVGGDWPARARAAALVLSGETDSGDLRTELLKDIREVFTLPRAHSRDLVTKLINLEDRPWLEFNRGRAMTGASLARMLKPFGIKAKLIRIGVEVARGYDLEGFEETFARYLPSPPISNVTPLQRSDGAGYSDSRNVTRDRGVTLSNPRKPSNGAGCNGVTLQNADPGGWDEKEAEREAAEERDAIQAESGRRP